MKTGCEPVANSDRRADFSELQELALGAIIEGRTLVAVSPTVSPKRLGELPAGPHFFDVHAVVKVGPHAAHAAEEIPVEPAHGTRFARFLVGKAVDGCCERWKIDIKVQNIVKLCRK